MERKGREWKTSCGGAVECGTGDGLIGEGGHDRRRNKQLLMLLGRA